MIGATFSMAVLAGTAILLACADVATEADRIPTVLVVSPPDSGRFTVGKPTKLELVVKDQHGETLPVPSWVPPPTWEATPSSVADVSEDGTVTGKEVGWVGVTARLAGLKTNLTYCMNPDRIVLTAPMIYLNQATQNRDGSVSLIAGRPALLRVFAVADKVNCLDSSIRVTLTRDNDVVFEQLVPTAAGRIPTSVDESELTGSYNVEIPGSAIQSGVEMVVELDPEGVASLAPESQTRYPTEGAMALDVVELPVYRIILVPTISRPAPDSAVLDWVDGVNPESEQMRLGRTILPVGDMEVEVHETYTTSLNLRDFWKLVEVAQRDRGSVRAGGETRVLLRGREPEPAGCRRDRQHRLSGERGVRCRLRLHARSGAHHESVARPLRRCRRAGPPISLRKRIDRSLGI